MCLIKRRPPTTCRIFPTEGAVTRAYQGSRHVSATERCPFHRLTPNDRTVPSIALPRFPAITTPGVTLPSGRKRVCLAAVTRDDHNHPSRRTGLLPMEAKHAQNLPEGPMGNGCCLHLESPAESGMRKRVDAPWTHCGETQRQPLTPSSDFQNWFLMMAANWMLRAGL